ncbi:hypothetical protein AGLY_001075 [Aphis glycines]|uniref:Uncharacterized protein n=1 Tax=Aphis glycines TaxID=307491 RepID=A0A6G0UB37_APHGL|nr:hypothetical protein AGLY_001075 [Aphis glycines]
MGLLLNECFYELQKYTEYISFNIMIYDKFQLFFSIIPNKIIYEYDSNDLIVYNSILVLSLGERQKIIFTFVLLLISDFMEFITSFLHTCIAWDSLFPYRKFIIKKNVRCTILEHLGHLYSIFITFLNKCYTFCTIPTYNFITNKYVWFMLKKLGEHEPSVEELGEISLCGNIFLSYNEISLFDN